MTTAENKEKTTQPQEVEALQRKWLQEAVKSKAKDIIAHARRTGERLHDQNLKDLATNLKRLSQAPKDKESLELQALREKYNPDAHNQSEEDPVYAALKPFLTTNGEARRRLENIARDYLSLEKNYLDMARKHPDREEHFMILAAAEREAADLKLHQSTESHYSTKQTTPKQPRALSNQRIPLKTLEKAIETFSERTRQTIHTRYRDQEDCEQQDHDEPSPEELYGTNTFSKYTPPPPFDPGEPDIRLDEQTLRSICRQGTGSPEIPDKLALCLIGPAGDAAIAREIALIEEQYLEDYRRRKAEKLCLAALEAHQKILEAAHHRFPPPPPKYLHDLQTLREAWENSGYEDSIPDYMKTLLKGNKGKDLRQKTFAKARATLLKEEEHHEKTNLGMTDRQRIEKRLDPEYKGSPLDLTKKQLQHIWEKERKEGQFPRAWLTQSHELTWQPLLDALLKREHAALELHRNTIATYNHAVQENASRATLAKRYRDTLLTLQNLLEIHQQVDQEFTNARLDVPAPPQHPEMPEPAESKNQAKLDLNIQVTNPSTRYAGATTNATVPRRPTKQPQTASMRLL